MKSKECRIIFLGTPDIAAYVLEALINDNYNIIGIVSQEDKEKSRKGVLLETPTKMIGKKYNIPVYQFDKIRLHVEEVAALKPDLILTLAYGQLVSQEILDIPSLGCINLHGSLLPKYRGAAPIQRVLFNGEKETGFTLMQMIKQMDAGLMYKKLMIKIDDSENFSSLYEKMKECAKDLILSSLSQYIEGKLVGISQDESEATFAPKILKEDEKMDINMNCTDFINKIRALSYKPGGYLLLDNEIIKIFKVHYLNDKKSCENGTIILADKTGIAVQLEDGVIMIDELQRQQKKMMKASDFINGYPNLKGKKFS
ncbi:MAG: methionyl-tRNA formyltransferase [Bacilli bacterium]